MEFQATKDHLAELEHKYGIAINRVYAKMPVAMACHKYGVPFLSKQVSEFIRRLQIHNFKWEDRSFDELYKEYPKCKAALQWWCNSFGENSKINISRNKHLKEFIIQEPPDFSISPMCCQKAKKDTAHSFQKENNADLIVQGVRKAEGGARSTAIHSCFTQNSFEADTLRPLFWFKKKDCEQYDDLFAIEHSDCYSKYGLCRTGCACCPFGRDFERELEAAQTFEPKLHRLSNLVFGKSYEYTRKYREFCKKMEENNAAYPK